MKFPALNTIKVRLEACTENCRKIQDNNKRLGMTCFDKPM